MLAILTAAAIWFGRELINPLVIGALLAFVLNPAIRFLTRRTRMSHSLAASIVLFIGLGGIVVLSVIMVPRVIAEIQIFYTDLQEILSQIQRTLSQPVIILDRVFHIENLLPDLNQFFSDSISAIPGSTFYLLEATSKNLIWGFVILATVFYLLRDWTRLRDWLFNFIPVAYQPDAHRVYCEIRQIWQGYLRGNLTLMIIVGIMFTLAWFAIGLPGALILGILAGVLTIIPDLGPAIAAALAVMVALFEGSTYLNISNLWCAMLVIGIYLLLINIKGIWIRPRIFARSVHMHEGVVFIAIMVAVVLLGILGALVIVPVLASVGVLGRYVYQHLVESSPKTPYEMEENTEDDFENAA